MLDVKLQQVKNRLQTEPDRQNEKIVTRINPDMTLR
jgi:hypothetical protein